MAETNYTYSVSVDFPDGKVISIRLQKEISKSSIITECLYINTDNDDCVVCFVDALSGVDKLILDGIVSNHSGVYTYSGPQNILSAHNSTATQTFTSTITLNFTEIKVGEMFTLNTVGGGIEVTTTIPGWCKITYDVTIEGRGNGRTGSMVWLEKNGVFIPGTRSFGYHRNVASGKNTVSCNSLVEFGVGDTVRLRMNRNSGNSTLSTTANSCRLYIELL